MPLPQQVINQISNEPTETPGWSSGVIWFSVAFLAVVVGIYLFLLAIYGPYTQSSLSSIQSKVATVDQSISSSDESQLATFYARVVNLKSLLQSHILFSQFLSWLEQNTEANVYYNAFAFSAGDQVTLSGMARTEADVNQQVAIFESSPQVKKVSITNLTIINATGMWSFSASLLMDSAIFSAPTSTSP